MTDPYVRPYFQVSAAAEPRPHVPGTPPCPHYLNIGSLIHKASFIAFPKPNRQNGNRNPTIEDGTSALGGSASGGLKKNPVCH